MGISIDRIYLVQYILVYYSRFACGLTRVDGTPPINQPTASVRAQTANLAALALQRTFSDSEPSPPEQPPELQKISDSYTPAIPDRTAFFQHEPPTTSPSPPAVLDDLVPATVPSSHRQSLLTHLIRTSPPEILEPPRTSPIPERPTVEIPSNHQLHVDSPHLITVSPSPMSEQSPLLYSKGRHGSYGTDRYLYPDESDELLQEHDIERQGLYKLWETKPWFHASHHRIRNFFKRCDRRTVWEQGIVDPLHRIPAVLLGLLLNILDALSYGMILFPLGQPIFESLGPDGISMFYVSCIISQLVYSLGGSVFKGGIGSEMVQSPFASKLMID